MPKQLNVNLAFTADTGKAAASIKQLQSQLTQLMNNAVKDSASLGLTKDIKEATTAVAQLKAQLSGAMSSTGTLDLTKFNDSLRASGMSLEQYRTKLSALGPEGTAAFSQLASSIASAEIPIRRANGLLTELGTTLANTARWQLSSSLLHGFIGGLQHAYGYAQDLNESLNNIRIVTGQSTEQMAQLAQKANQAARELSTRTTDYTNASLIYYQQGLDDKAVEARTRTTLKLANVTRQSAEEVSNQMTAIWNNFDDGTKSLEYYADAITALGAKTASSSSEIAEGLSKFAAVADTIGLSYETATAALATVVAETRQSADTVGNAFKSIFSRLQSLKLGETLEDGVGLTKYSEALDKVGVKVLDINGELREADDIMSDLGQRWTEISDTQKTALAQTVAGQRQYAQFVALFDNWDKVQQNIGIAEESEGTLQEQADIYAESWEASAKRVQASAEAIYDALLNDDFFIDLNNFISTLLNGVNGLIKGFGGLKGTLAIVGALITKTFSTQIASQIERISHNFSMMTQKGRDQAKQLQQESLSSLEKEATVAASRGSQEGIAQATGLKAQKELQETLYQNQARYNEEQMKTAQILLDQNASLREQAAQAGKIADLEKQRANNAQTKFLTKASQAANKQGEIFDEAHWSNTTNILKTFTEQGEILSSTFITLKGVLKETFKDPSAEVEILQNQFQEILPSINSVIAAIEQNSGAMSKEAINARSLRDALKLTFSNFDGTDESINKINFCLDHFLNLTQQVGTSVESDLIDMLSKMTGKSEEAEKAVQELVAAYQKGGEAFAQAKEKVIALATATDAGKDKMKEMGNNTISTAQKITSFASVALSLSSVITTLKTGFETMADSEMTAGEKMNSVLSSIPSLLMSVGMLSSALTSTASSSILASLGSNAFGGSLLKLSGVEAVTAGTTATLGQAFLTLAPYLLIVAGAVAALTFAFDAMEKASIDYKLKEAEKAAEQATERLNETKKAAEDLSSAFENYQTIRDELDNCTTGTEEWRNKLREVNETVLDIIKNYPELAKYLENKNGSLGLNEEGVKEYQQLQNSRIYADQAVEFAANQQVQELELEKKRSEFLTNDAYSYEASMMGQKAWENYARVYEGEDRSQFTEALLDAFIQLRSENKDTNPTDENANQVYTAAIEKVLEDTGLKNNENFNLESIMANFKDEFFNGGLGSFFENYNREAENAKSYYESANKILATQVLSNDEEYMKQDHATDTLGVADRVYESILSNVSQKNAALLENSEDLKNRYAELYGGKTTETRRDAQGNEYEQELTNEEMLAKINTIEASNQLADGMSVLLKTTSELASSEDEAKQGVGKILEGSKIDDGTGEALLEKVTDENGNISQDLIREYISNNIIPKDQELQDFARDMGFTGEQVGLQLINSFVEGLSDLKQRRELAQNFENDTAQSFFDQFKEIKPETINEASTAGLEIFNTLLSSIFENPDAASSYQDLMTFFGEHTENFDEILEAINSSNNFEELQNNLQDLGVVAAEDAPILEILFNGLSKFKDLEDPTEKYASRSKVLSKINQKGDIIEEEDYNTLGPAAKSYFQIMADGTYSLIGDAEQLKQTIKDIAFDDFLRQFNNDKENWDAKVQGQQAIQVGSLAKIQEVYKKGDGEEVFGQSEDKTIIQKQNYNKEKNYGSIKEVMKDYNDIAEYEGQTPRHALTGKDASEKIKDIIESNKIEKDGIDAVNEAYDKKLVSAQLYAKGIQQIAAQANNIEELDEIIGKSKDDSVDLTDTIIQVINQSGGTTKEQIAMLKHELEEGNGKAKTLLKTMYELNAVNDSEKTTLQNINENNKTNESIQNDDKISDAKKAQSNKQAGLANIDLIANADDMFNTDKISAYNEEMQKVRQGTKLTAIEARQLGQAAAQIFKDADFLGTEKQIQGIKNAFAAVDGEIEPENLKAYADSIKDLILNSESMTLDKKLETVKRELTDAGVPISYLNKELGELILADQNLSLDEKLERIKEACGGNIPQDLKHEIEKILANESTSTEDALKRIKEICGDDYVLQETASWIDKILNNGGTGTLEKLREILSAAGQLGVDQSAKEMAKLYQDDIKNYQDFQQIKTNNETSIANSQANVENKTQEVAEAQTAMNQNASAGASVQDYYYSNLTQKQKELNQAVEDEAAARQTAAESFQRYAQDLNGANFDSLREMQAVEQGLIESGAQITEQMKAQDIIEYASKFDSCTPAIEKYESALAAGVDTTKELAEVMMMADAEDQAAAFGVDAEYVQRMAQSYVDLATAEEDHNATLLGDIEVVDNATASYDRLIEAATDAAVRTARADAANQDFASNGDKYLKFLDNVTEGLEDYTEEQIESGEALTKIIHGNKEMSDTYAKLRKTIANTLDVQEEFLDEKDVTNYAKKAIDAYKDIGGSLEELQKEYTKGNLIDLGATAEEAEQQASEIMDSLSGLNPGDILDISEGGAQEAINSYLQSIVNDVIASGGSIDEAVGKCNDALSSLGVDADITGYENVTEDVKAAAEDMANTMISASDEAVAQSGIDSKVNTYTDTSEDTSTVTGFDTTAVPGDHFSITVPQFKASTLPGTDQIIPEANGQTTVWGTTQGIQVTPKEEDVTETKQTTAPGIEVSNPHMSTGGKVGGGSRGGGGGRRGGGCFIAGTLITTGNKYKNIEDIKVGDIVLSYNEKLKRNEYSVVLQTMIHKVYDNIYTLYVEDDQLVVTGIHRFLIFDGIYTRWVAAEDLQVGDYVLFANGTIHQIKKIDVILKFETVYNFEVSNNHNYYVGKNQILAHNKGRGGRGGGRGRAARTQVVRSQASVEHAHTNTRYHMLDKSLEALNRQYADINKNKDLAFGEKHLKALEAEIQKQDELIAKNKEYINQISTYKKHDLGDLIGGNGLRAIGWNEDAIAYQSTTFKDAKQTTYEKVGKKKGNYALINGTYQKVGKNKGNYKAKTENVIKETENTNYVNVGLDDLDLGVKLETNDLGLITNYDDVMKALDAWRNKKADEYVANYHPEKLGENATAAQRQEMQNIQNEWNKNEAIYEALKKKIEQYEQDVQDYLDKVDEIIDNHIAAAQLRLEKVTYKVDWKIEMDDAEIERLEFLITALGDSARNASKTITYLGKELKKIIPPKDEENNEVLSPYAQGIADLFKTYTTEYKILQGNGAQYAVNSDSSDAKYYDGDTIVKSLQEKGAESEYIDTIRKMGQMSDEDRQSLIGWTQSEMKRVEDILDKRQQMFDTMNNAIDEYIDKLDYEVSQQQTLLDISKSYLDVIDLIGRANIYAEKTEVTTANGEKKEYRRSNNEQRNSARTTEANIDKELNLQADKRLASIKREQEAVQTMLNEFTNKEGKAHYDELKKKYQEYVNDNNTEMADQYKDQLEKYEESLRTLTEKNQSLLLDQQNALIEALTQKQEAFERALTRAAEAFNDSMSNIRGTLDILQSSIELRQKVMDTYVADYEKVHQLRQLDLEAQKSIDKATDPKIQRELLAIQEEITQSAYNGKQMSQYELDYLRQKLELKQAEAALNDAQQAKTQVSLTRDNEGNFGYVYTADDANVADAEKNYEDKIYEMRKANAEYINQIEADLVQAEIDYQAEMQEIATNNDLDEATKMAEMQRISDEYSALHQNLTDQLTIAMNATTDIYNQYSNLYSEITGDLMSKQVTYAKSFKDTILGQMSGYDSLEERTQAWEESFKNYNTSMQTAVQEYGTQCAETYKQIASDATEYFNSASETTKSYTTQVGNLKDEIDKTAQEAETGFSKIVDEIVKNENEYLGHLQTWIDKANNLAEAINTAVSSMAELDGAVNGFDDGDEYVAPSGSNNDSSSSGSSSSKKGTMTYGRRTKRTRRRLVITARNMKKKLKRLTRKQARTVLRQIGVRGSSIKKAKKEIKKAISNGYKKVKIWFDTGGYTGDWSGNNGKVAMLHKKEMVLNQKDTSNILSAVDMIRGISEKIDLNALAQSGALSQGLSSGINGVSNGILEQDVHITAEFPNATDRNEITEAFNNIIGLAAQYANR